jgi:hypothetical protein
MNYHVRTTLAGSLILGALGGGVAFASSAFASHGGGDVRVQVRCTTGTLSLKAKPDSGRLETEAELDTNRVGQVWAWTLSHPSVRRLARWSGQPPVPLSHRLPHRRRRCPEPR